MAGFVDSIFLAPEGGAQIQGVQAATALEEHRRGRGVADPRHHPDNLAGLLAGIHAWQQSLQPVHQVDPGHRSQSHPHWQEYT